MIMTLNLKNRTITTSWEEDYVTDSGFFFTTTRSCTEFLPVGTNDTMELISGFIYGRITRTHKDTYKIIKNF